MEKEIQPDLMLIGLGLMIPDHITMQAQRAIVSCKSIFTIVQEPPELWLPNCWIGKIRVVNLLNLYQDGDLRTNNYDRAARTVLNAIPFGTPVGYITYGNPMIYDRVGQNLISLSRAESLALRVIPGISSIDTVLCDLMLDMAPGLQVIDASWLVAFRIEPNLTTPLLLVQVGAFGSFRSHYSKRQDGSSLADLCQYLYQFYPKSHMVALIRSTNNSGANSNVVRLQIQGLSDVSAEDLAGASLYIGNLISPQLDDAAAARMART